MIALKLLLLAYIISVIVTYFIARAAISDRSYRIFFTVMAAAIPFTAVYALLKSIFSTSSAPPRVSNAMCATEDAIEAERVRIFGDQPMTPSVADWIQKGYEVQLQKYAEKAARASKRLDEFGSHFQRGLR